MSSFDDAMDSMMVSVTQVMGRSVKLYKPGTTAAFDYSTGTRSFGTPTEYTVSANEGPRRQISIQETGGELVIWAKQFDVRVADIGGLIPTLQWRLGETDGTFETACPIVSVEVDANGKGVVLFVKDNL